ncbi:MAG: hypothetical protein JO157_14035, partial [Acetobacteraceae bacterium]|nr:hypothetical protein [Acetobacteraceae bacterium]
MLSVLCAKLEGRVMNWSLILILLAVCAGLLWSGIRRRGGIYEYPFLAGATFLGFVLPQMPALADDPYLPGGAFAKAAFFTTLCAAACWVGWVAGNRPLASLQWTLDKRRVVWLAAVLTAAGGIFYYKLSTLPKEALDASLYSGLPVAYLFLAKMLSYGLYLAVLCLMRSQSKLALAVALVGASLLLHRTVIEGRRGELAEFLLVAALSAWFTRGAAVPRAVALIGALLAGLALNSTGDYRSATKGQDGPKWSEISRIDVLGNFIDVLKNGGPEMRNAVLRINAADEMMAFDFGLFHWNILVYNFVPAQLVGREAKNSLFITMPDQYGRGYDPPTGTTETGMADAFASFWYLGFLKFFLIAYALSRLYRTAMQGSLAAQVIYMVSVVPAMLAITHHTQWVLSTWVHVALFLLSGLALARIPAG